MEQNEKNKLPEHIMKMLRLRLGLNEEDTSEDDFINSYSDDKVFSEILTWKGFIGWSKTIKGWIEDVYGVKLGE